MKCLIYVEVYLHGMYGPFVGTRACILDGEIIIHNCFGLLDYNNLLEMLNYFLLLYFN